MSIGYISILSNAHTHLHTHTHAHTHTCDVYCVGLFPFSFPTFSPPALLTIHLFLSLPLPSLFTQISTLVTLQLLVQMSSRDVLDGAKYKVCEVVW